MTADWHCPTCICGRRAPVQGTWEADRSKRRGPGTITWAEHLEAYVAYSGQYGTGQCRAEHRANGVCEECGSRPCMCGLWDDDDDEDCPASPETRTTL